MRQGYKHALKSDVNGLRNRVAYIWLQSPAVTHGDEARRKAHARGISVCGPSPQIGEYVTLGSSRSLRS